MPFAEADPDAPVRDTQQPFPPSDTRDSHSGMVSHGFIYLPVAETVRRRTEFGFTSNISLALAHYQLTVTYARNMDNCQCRIRSCCLQNIQNICRSVLA